MQQINWKDEKKRAYFKNIFLFRFDRLFQKRDNKRWVFGGREGHNYDDNCRYLFEWVNLNHPEIDSTWICREESVVAKVRQLGYNAYLADSKEGISASKKAGVAVYSHSIIDLGLHPRIGGAFVATTWHGVGFKKIYRLSHKGLSLFIKDLADRLFSWTYRNLTIATSSFSLKGFVDCFGLKEHDRKAICGQPRNDIYKSTLSKEEILAGTGIDPKKNLILYMPTYRGPAMGADAMGQIVRDLYNSQELNVALEKTNSVFVAKLHPLTPHIDIKNRENFMILDYSAVKDNQKLLAIGDMMISDYSATIVDFALLERPVLFYMPDHEKFMTYSEPLFDEFFDLCKYDNCSTPAELAEKILHPSKAAVNAINELFEDPSIKGTCYCENVYNTIAKEVGL